MTRAIRAAITPSPKGRRAEILDATLRVISKGGVDSVTHRKVSAEGDIPLGSITYHFETRDDLIRESFRAFLEESRTSLRDLERQAGGTTLDNYPDIVVAISERDLIQPIYYRAEYEMLVFAARSEDLAADLKSYHLEIDGLLATALENAGISKPMEAARILRGATRGFEIDRLSNPQLKIGDLRRCLEVTIAGLLKGATS